MRGQTVLSKPALKRKVTRLKAVDGVPATPKRKVSSRKATAPENAQVQTGLHPTEPAESAQVQTGLHPTEPAESAQVQTGLHPSKMVLQVPPADLTVHPDLEEVAGLSAQDEAQLEQSIKEVGRVVQPIIINSSKQVLDGRHRRAIAERLQLLTIPVIVDDGLEALDLAISSALDRRHLSQGQRALFVFKLHRLARAEWEGKTPDFRVRKQAGKKYVVSNSVASYDLPSFRELSRRYHISDVMFGWLNQMWNNSELKEWKEIMRQIESGEKKLKSLWHGFGGRVGTKGAPRNETDIAKQTEQSVSNLVGTGQYWSSYEIPQRRAYIESHKEAWSKVPHDLAFTHFQLLREIIEARGPQG